MRERHLRGWSHQGVGMGTCRPRAHVRPTAVGQPTLVDLLRVLHLSAYHPGLGLPPLTGQTATGEEVSIAELRGALSSSTSGQPGVQSVALKCCCWNACTRILPPRASQS